MIGQSLLGKPRPLPHRVDKPCPALPLTESVGDLWGFIFSVRETESCDLTHPLLRVHERIQQIR